MTNKTAWLTAQETLEVKDSPLPAVAAGDVLIRIRHTGICGSDIHIYQNPYQAKKMKLPAVLGHECAGEVVSFGKDVSGFEKGDLVALEPGVPCGHCRFCREGRYNLCPEVVFMGATPFLYGAFSQYVAHPARMVFKLPSGMNTLQGSLLEPFSVGLHAVARANARPGNSALILGCGCIGLMVLLALRALGVERIAVADLFGIRLEQAKELGAWETVNSHEQDLRDTAGELTKGAGFDFVFETAGSRATASMTTDLVARGGKIVMVGNTFGETPIKLFALNQKEADILSVFRYRNLYPSAIELVASGKAPVEKIVSDIYPLGRIQEAFTRAQHAKESAVKLVIDTE